MEENFYHILNRGVEKRKLFLCEENYLRFVHNMRDFNNQNLSLLSYKNRRKYLSEVTPPKIVDVLSWCLMPNHFHILALEVVEKGTSIFSQKLTGGYTMYFNPRNKRVGTLFQGRSKIIPVEKEAHFLWLPFYIFANPLNLYQADWRKKGIKNPKKAFRFLIDYPWSSISDLLGLRKNNLPEIINKKLFFELFNTDEKYFENDFMEWLEDYEGDKNEEKFGF